MQNIFEDLVLPRVVSHSIRKCYLHPVKWEIVFKELNPHECDIDWLMTTSKEGDENCEMDLSEVRSNTDLMAEIKEKVNALTWDSIVYPVETLEGFSLKNGNTDNRGGGCGNLNIDVDDFEYTITNPGGVTLRNLTELVYRLKGSKYDWWYELYSTFVEQHRTDKKVLIEVQFGYGS